MDYKLLAGVDIGGTKVTASVSDISGIKAKVYQPVRLDGTEKSVPEQVDFLIGYASDVAGTKKSGIDAVGISTCSPFRQEDIYRVVIAPNLCGGLAKERGRIPNTWLSIPLEEELTMIYKTVKMGNDCVTAVVAEKLFGAGKGEDNLVYVTWSTGIGSGAYVDGILIEGKNGNAPHIGHIFIAEDGPQCGCGNFGDLESLASGTAIERDYAELTGEKKTCKEIFGAYGWNPPAERVIDRAARNFARGIVSMNAILDSRLFVIGGSMMNDSDILLPLVRKEFYRSFPALSEGTEIVPSPIRDYLGDLAALSLVMPAEWVKEWEAKEPWKYAPPAIKLDKYGNELRPSV